MQRDILKDINPILDELGKLKCQGIFDKFNFTDKKYENNKFVVSQLNNSGNKLISEKETVLI